jgi:sulfonate transport system substrate-binding protein
MSAIRQQSHRAITRASMAAITLLIAAALSGCGSSTSSSSGASGAAGAQSGGATPTVPDHVPPGTTLRVADQLQLLETVLSTASNDKSFSYKLQYSNFVGGPPMLQAFHAGAVDIGFVADTPLIFAQAAKQDIVAVAAWAPEHGSQELIATPGSNITSWADLKGKKVAYQRGTVLEAVLLQGLKSADLSLGDITSVNLPVTQVAAALQGGSVQAAILAPPLDTAYLKSHPTAKVVARADDITDRVSFIVASKSALANPGKVAAIQDYVVRLIRSYGFIAKNPSVWVKSFYVKQYHMTEADGAALLARSGPSKPVALPGTLVPAQQALADLYQDAGEIPEKLDAAAEFDGRFDAAIQKAATS